MSDSDDEAMEFYTFVTTLRSAVQLYVQNEDGKAVYKKGTDPSLDILFKTSVTGTNADGYDVRLFSCPAANQLLSSIHGRAAAENMYNTHSEHTYIVRARQVLICLDLSALPANFPV